MRMVIIIRGGHLLLLLFTWKSKFFYEIYFYRKVKVKSTPRIEPDIAIGSFALKKNFEYDFSLRDYKKLTYLKYFLKT